MKTFCVPELLLSPYSLNEEPRVTGKLVPTNVNFIGRIRCCIPDFQFSAFHRSCLITAVATVEVPNGQCWVGLSDAPLPRMYPKWNGCAPAVEAVHLPEKAKWNQLSSHLGWETKTC